MMFILTVCVLGQEQTALYLVALQSAPLPQGGRPGGGSKMIKEVQMFPLTCLHIVLTGIHTTARGALALSGEQFSFYFFFYFHSARSVGQAESWY